MVLRHLDEDISLLNLHPQDDRAVLTHHSCEIALATLVSANAMCIMSIQILTNEEERLVIPDAYLLMFTDAILLRSWA